MAIPDELTEQEVSKDVYKRQSRDYFRALALCRKPKETGTFPSLTDEQKAIIENIRCV